VSDVHRDGDGSDAERIVWRLGHQKEIGVTLRQAAAIRHAARAGVIDRDIAYIMRTYYGLYLATSTIRKVRKEKLGIDRPHRGPAQVANLRRGRGARATHHEL
jgi:hypothetical protein